MKAINDLRERLFPKPQQLPSGFFHYHSPEEVLPAYRLQLRLENDGTGILIINAKTILHLNQTAAEHVHQIIKGDSIEAAAKTISKRYNVPYIQILEDAKDINERIRTIIETPTIDPVTFFDFDRVEPYSSEISAPYRLDCALTYKTGEETSSSAPLERVKRELLSEEWKTILMKAWQVGIPQIVFTGGEPTLRPDLCDLIDFAQKQGQVTGLLTNGIRLSERDYLHSLLNGGLDHVMIILDSESSQVWESIRDVAMEDLFMTVHITISRQNAAQSKEILDRLADTMGKNRSISLSTESTDLKENLLAWRDTATQLGFQLVWDLPVPYSSLNPVDIELNQDEQPSKSSGTSWLYVEPDGDVLTAQGVTKVLGNLLTDSWETIWNNRL
jgi:hypothetical protein